VSLTVVLYVLTALAAVVVVLTRARMGRGQGAGRVYVGARLLDVHTGAGTLAIIAWLVFLIAPKDTMAGGSAVGILAIGLWVVTTIAGLLILVRWLPSRGKHASEGRQDRWSDGPGLSVLAHVGLLVGVAVFFYAYVNGKG